MEQAERPKDETELTPSIIKEALSGDKKIRCKFIQEQKGTTHDDGHQEIRYDCALEDGTQFSINDYGDGDVVISNEQFENRMHSSYVRVTLSNKEFQDLIEILPIENNILLVN